MATRMNQAVLNFNETIINISGCSDKEAQKVTGRYLKEKIAKLDAVNGVIRVQHGIFLEPDIISNAINEQG